MKSSVMLLKSVIGKKVTIKKDNHTYKEVLFLDFDIDCKFIFILLENGEMDIVKWTASKKEFIIKVHDPELPPAVKEALKLTH